jgi:hypothetical protein
MAKVSNTNQTRNVEEIREMTNQDIVISSYPRAILREIESPSGSYFMIYDMAPIAPNLLGMDMKESEGAWKMAAENIGKRMVKTLEKE